jgi:lysophospholipase L1-like esterase
MKKLLLFVLLSHFGCTLLSAQKLIVVLGSSTAAGGVTTSPDSAWAGRLRTFYNKNNSDGLDTTLMNFGFPGYVTYQIMPTDFVTPPNRALWPVDPVRNVTRARDLRADVVIINMPSNDIDLYPDYNMKETMDNFRLMFQYLNAAGIRTYISTSQPRNDRPDNMRQMLRQLRDSILNNFGTYAINFWDELVTTDGQNRLQDDRRADDIHPNNFGHRLLYERVVAKNIFAVNAPLPVKLSFFKAQVQNGKVAVSWRAEGQETGTTYEVERSSNGRDYTAVHTQAATTASSGDYLWQDAAPLKGTSHYRLKIREASKSSYSTVARVAFEVNKLIASLFVSGTTLNIDLGQGGTGKAELHILNPAGAVVLKRAISLGDNRVQVPIGSLSAGQYFLRLALPGGRSEVQAFNRSN